MGKLIGSLLVLAIFSYEEVKDKLIEWLKMHVTPYFEYLDQGDPFKQFYDEEFVDFFTNDDDDDDDAMKPFDIGRQEVLHYFLKYAETTINKADDLDEGSKKEIIDQINALDNNIPNLTKKRLSLLYQKLRKALKL